VPYYTPAWDRYQNARAQHFAPIFGVGQGTIDSPARWGFVCDYLITLNKKLATNVRTLDPTSQTKINRKIDALFDNTALLMTILKHTPYLILILKQNAQLWELLLFAARKS
jgi:hypothetical protein